MARFGRRHRYAAIRAQSGDSPAVSRILRLKSDGEYAGVENVAHTRMQGWFPRAQIDYDDPALPVTVEEREIPKKTLFGNPIYDPETGQPKVDHQRYFDGRNFLLYAEGVPVFVETLGVRDLGDAWVDGIDLPVHLPAGALVKATVRVGSQRPSVASVALRDGARVLASKQVPVDAGTTNVPLDVTFDREGAHARHRLAFAATSVSSAAASLAMPCGT